MTAKTALDGTYKTYALPSAEKMLKLTEKITPDLILLDVEMPVMNGFEAMSFLKYDVRLKDIPVIFLTAKNDPVSEIKGFEMGALDFINKPFSAPVLIRRIETHTELDKLIKRSQSVVRKVNNATIKVISDMVESRDKTTGGHIERTQKYLEILIDELVRSELYSDEVGDWDMDLVIPSAQLHDVGKIAISDAILNKPGKLTNEEFEHIKSHSTEGEVIIDKIISDVEDDVFLCYAKRFAAYHHEKWDGTGYPYGLKEYAIPLEGRIMAIADVYDALVSVRPYKKPFTHEQAFNIITEGSGTHFDPNLVAVFKAVADEFEATSKCAVYDL
ncbi:MAG: response regulator [Oscillospiraceae bacterium]|nr:response regulator [Oscillospiraceae bacterium]